MALHAARSRACFSALWLVWAGCGSGEPPVPEPVGSARCAVCHPEQARAWEASNHARAEGPVPADLVWHIRLGDGVAPRPVRTLGVEPLVQYLVPLEGGRLQVTQEAWDPAKQEWFDVFGDGRGPGEWGHWTGGGMTWNSQCAGCHSTGVSKGYDAQSGTYDTRAVEHGVGCTACHGDAPGHGVAGGPSPVVSDLDECAACHSRRAELTAQYVPGEPFLDHFAPHLVDAGDTFWPDGQVREEDFEWTVFVSSKMHGAGVTCTTCHDPHSGALVREPVCATCHADLPDHDPHPAGAAVDCVGCHMPVTTYMQRDPRHDHGFAVPDVALQAELGIPDPCTRCHTERDPAWAAAQAARWWPRPDPERRARIRALADGRRLEPGAVPGLMTVFREDRPAFRAAAAAVLAGYTDRRDVQQALVAGLRDPEPLVRFAAAGSLASLAGDPTVEQALRGALGDPLRAVRVQAGRSLRSRVEPNDPAVADYATYLELHADVPSGLHERAGWNLERGRTGAAVADLRKAVEMDPRSPLIRDTLAVTLARLGDAGGAASQLREAVKLDPDDATLWYRLGLAEAGVHNLPAARAALEKSAALAPDEMRTWYNLGLVRQQLRDPSAVDALRRAERLAPADPEPAYAVASALWNAGDPVGARAQAKRVLSLDPHHEGARQLLAAGQPR